MNPSGEKGLSEPLGVHFYSVDSSVGSLILYVPALLCAVALLPGEGGRGRGGGGGGGEGSESGPKSQDCWRRGRTGLEHWMIYYALCVALISQDLTVLSYVLVFSALLGLQEILAPPKPPR